MNTIKNKRNWGMMGLAFAGAILPTVLFEICIAVLGMSHVRSWIFVSTLYVVMWPLPWIWMMVLISRSPPKGDQSNDNCSVIQQ